MHTAKSLSPAKYLSVSKHRIDALADGVCAIVITLLVLELKIPELPHRVSVGELGGALMSEGPVFFSFVITFAFASLFWYAHHAVMNFIEDLRPRLIVLNIAFLLFMALLPFSVGMLGRFLRNPLAQTIYFGNQFVISLMLWLLWHSARSLGLLAEPASQEAGKLNVRLTAVPIGAALAAAVAWINVTFSFYAFTFVLIVARLLARRKYPRA